MVRPLQCEPTLLAASLAASETELADLRVLVERALFARALRATKLVRSIVL
jgi:hypothetical protein